MALFCAALNTVTERGQVPPGYNLLPEEGMYPTSEILRSGRRGLKELRISLPLHIWKPRALYWSQGLRIMTTILEDRTSTTDDSTDMDEDM